MYSSSVFKQFNWVSTPSAYQSAQAWKEKRSAMVSDFQTQSATVVNSFTSATINQTLGMGDLAAKAAVARIQTDARGTTNSASTAKYNFSI